MKKKIISLVLAIVIICLLIALFISVRHSKVFRMDNKENLGNNINEQVAKNDQVEIRVEDISLSDDYLILKYNLKSTDPNMDLSKIAINEHGENQLRLDRRIKINNHTITKEFVYTTQVSEIKSAEEASVYDIIDISNEEIPSDFDINIRFLENEYTTYFVEIMSEEEFEALESADTSLAEGQEEYVAPEIDYGLLQENSSPEDYYEVEGEYEFTEELSNSYENSLDNKEGPALGDISCHLKKSDLQKNVEQIEYANQYSFDNLELIKGTIIKTTKKEFIIFTSELKNLNYDKLYTIETGGPYVLRFEINDQENNNIIVNENHEITITDADNNLESEVTKESKEIKATVKNYILLNNIIDGFTIRPYYYNNFKEKVYIGEGI